MHSHAATSPVTVAQVNQAVSEELGFEDDPDKRQFCTNCHGPIPTLITASATLPFEDPRVSLKALNEGITCVTCHKYDVNAEPIEGYAALSEFQDYFNAGPYMFGPYEDPMENSFHESFGSPLFVDGQDADKLCSSCHQVGMDLNGDGDIRVGEDFVLQNLNQEYREYRAQGGAETCVSCHMPESMGQAAQVPGAPTRKVRSHVFFGVDYPLDEVADNGADPLKSPREQLLRSAAKLEIANVDQAGSLLRRFDITIENSGTGHTIPSGFAFMRQMWLEVRVTDPSDAQDRFESGVLDSPSHDLCDLNTLDDGGQRVHPMIGCDAAQDRDEFLVNLQTQLLDRVELVNGQVLAADGAQEHWLPLLTGGAVARKRPIDGAVLAPLKPFETQRFSYPVNVTAGPGTRIRARLLFRNLPPYMVRELGRNQPRNEIQLGPLVEYLQITEISSKEVTLP